MFFQIDRNANSANNVMQLKSALVSSLNTALQIQRESAEMTEVQIQDHYGFSGTQAQWTTTINGVVTALQVTAVDNYISQLG